MLRLVTQQTLIRGAGGHKVPGDEVEFRHRMPRQARVLTVRERALKFPARLVKVAALTERQAQAVARQRADGLHRRIGGGFTRHGRVGPGLERQVRLQRLE